MTLYHEISLRCPHHLHMMIDEDPVEHVLAYTTTMYSLQPAVHRKQLQ